MKRLNVQILQQIRSFGTKTEEILSRQHQADKHLAERFNLADLNNGKNPFNVQSNSLLNMKVMPEKQSSMKEIKSMKQKKEAKNNQDDSNIYSMEHLNGKRKRKQNSKFDPFNVASSKLM